MSNCESILAEYKIKIMELEMSKKKSQINNLPQNFCLVSFLSNFFLPVCRMHESECWQGLYDKLLKTLTATNCSSIA